MADVPWRYVLVVDGRDIELADGEVTLGRSRTATVRVDHESVSRTHALLTLDRGTAILKDLNSSNGTFVAGRRVVGETRLAGGERLQLGAAVLELRVVEASGPIEKTTMLPASYEQEPEPAREAPPPQPPEREPVPPGPLEISADELVRRRQRVASTSGAPAVAAAVSALAAVRSAGAPAPEEPPGEPSPPPMPALRPPMPPPLVPEPPPRRREETLSQVPLDLGGPRPPSAGRIPRPRPSAAYSPDPRPPAGFFPRLLAFLVDGVILTAINLLLLSPAFLLYFFSHEFQKAEVARDWAFLGISLVCSLLIFAADLWYVVGGWARTGRTPGKALLRLAVVVDGKPGPGPGIGTRRAFLRVLGTWLSGALLGIGFLMVLFRKDRRALHDLIAGTRVVLRG